MITVTESRSTVFSYPNYIYVDSLYYAQPNLQKLRDRSIVAPTIKEESIELIRQGDFLKCLSPENALIMSGKIGAIRFHVFLNEKAELLALGVSFYYSGGNHDLVILDETELKCLIDFINTLQFDYEYKPEGEFILKTTFSFRIIM
jgi:hypothetical protein